jgi:hypothetical protein
MAKAKIETLKELAADISNEVTKYGMTKRRLEWTRCDSCVGKVRVSAGVMLRIARAETTVVCGKCLGDPGHPVEKKLQSLSGD